VRGGRIGGRNLIAGEPAPDAVRATHPHHARFRDVADAPRRRGGRNGEPGQKTDPRYPQRTSHDSPRVTPLCGEYPMEVRAPP